MTEGEATRWAHIIHDAITGKWVTIWCRDVRACKSDFHDCLSVIKAMGLWHRARCLVGHYEIVIGENIRDGGIDFRTPDMDRRRCGDPR